MNTKLVFGCVFPVFVTLLLIYSYYCYIIELCLNKLMVNDKLYDYVSILLILYHINFFLLLWSFLKVTITKHDQIPDKYKLNDEFLSNIKIQSSTDIKLQVTKTDKDNDDMCSFYKGNNNKELNQCQIKMLEQCIKDKGIKLMTRNHRSEVNVCLTCKLIKPDRCHHCSVCNKCILKMDHHCPWVNQCIGYSNQKYFILFLLYVNIYLIFILSTSASSFVQSWREEFINFHTEYNLFIMFTVAIVAFIPLITLLIMMIRLSAINRTNIEDSFPPIDATTKRFKSDMFNLGSFKKNFQQVFGDSIILALIPVWTTMGNGYEYSEAISEL